MIVKNGAKSVYSVVSADEKECITVLFMVNAAGTMVPPMLLHGYKRVHIMFRTKCQRTGALVFRKKVG